MSMTPCCNQSSHWRSIAASTRSAAAWYSVSCKVVGDMVDRIRGMNERQGSSLAVRRRPARGAVLGACALSLGMALAACGQKGPLFLPAQSGL
ncbi:MAG: LPS translocon maturation chaperone LptM, partial [Vitreoscilla sp.]